MSRAKLPKDYFAGWCPLCRDATDTRDEKVCMIFSHPWHYSCWHNFLNAFRLIFTSPEVLKRGVEQIAASEPD